METKTWLFCAPMLVFCFQNLFSPRMIVPALCSRQKRMISRLILCHWSLMKLWWLTLMEFSFLELAVYLSCPFVMILMAAALDL